ncbi:hypothetical protein [Oceanispirochaeta sp. M1]|uniref:hypothetical protein n=2 Tax=Oceanispirochaeta TaxID=2035349 RepID=UPI000E09B3F7|nr:hypothetical protein [Oceanispirochaeta sp. M1]
MEEKRKDTPEYFRMESFRREEYLSQLGSFTQVQYQLFHNLCDFWEPVLDYNQFILKSSKSFLASNNQLELLMGKLKAAHIGVLQYAIIEGELKASQIILTEKDDLAFYYYLGEDLLARQIYENPHPYLTAKAYDDEGISLPADMITPLDTSMLSPGYAAENKELIIIGINRKMKAPLLIPSGMIEEFISALIGHIRSEAASPSVMENMSRITEIKISDLQTSLGKRSPDFWINLCKKLLSQKEELKLRLKGLNPLLFTSAQLLQSYFQNTLSEMKQAEIENREKKEALKEIIQEFKEKETTWTHISLLDEKLKEKEEKWPGFREEFKNSVLVRGESKEQPDLVLLNNMLMHRDFLFKYFTRTVDDIRKDLLFLYQDQMTDLLRHNKTDRYSQFFSRSNFRSDILTRVKEQELQLWELLQKPTRVAESAFHYLQDIKGIKKNSRIKDAMGLYFHADMKNFRNVDTMFQLKLLSLFEKSYKEMSWFGRFVLRLTGRYDSYISMFSDDPVVERKQRPPSRRKRRKNKGIPTKGGVKSYSAKGPQERPYSPREKRKAWAEFDDAINRQK